MSAARPPLATVVRVAKVPKFCLPPMARAPIACGRVPSTSLDTCTPVDHATGWARGAPQGGHADSQSQF